MSKTRSFFKTITQFRRNGFFVSTFVILSLLTLVITIVFYAYANSFYSKSLKDKTYQSSANTLASASNTLDSMLEQVLLTTTGFMKDNNVVEATIVPNELNYTRNRNIARQISSILQSNPLIHNFYYYVSANETVYASDNGVVNYTDFYNFTYREAIESYRMLAQPGGVRLSRGLATDLIPVGGRLYIYNPFPVSNLLGLTVIQLDYEMLLESIQVSGAEIYIYDGSGQPLFDGREYPLPSLPEGKAAVDAWEDMGNIYYLHTAESTGLSYLCTIPEGVLSLSENLRLMEILPFMLVILVASLLCSVIITGKLYKPIHNLLKSVYSNSGEFGDEQPVIGKNELDFFRIAYEDIAGKARWLKELTDNMTPAVLERMFYRIILDTCPDDMYVENTLESIGNPCKVDDIYLLLLGEVVPGSGTIITEKERRLCHERIIGAIRVCAAGSFQTSFINRDGYTVYIICFPEHNLAQVIQMVPALNMEIGRTLKQFPFTLLFSLSAPCTCIYDLRLSYQEALQGLRTIRLLRDSGSAAGGAPSGGGEGETALHVPTEEDFLRQRVAYLVQITVEGNKDRAEDFAARMIKDILSSSEDPATVSASVKAFAELLIEQMSSHSLKEQAEQHRARLYEHLNESGGVIERMERYVTLFSVRLIEVLDANVNKSALRHIQAARNYMQEKYSDSALSLNSVSEHIGVTPSHLSRLLNAHLNQGFSSYINWIRVEKAKELLRDTNHSSATVCERTGFNSVQSFNRVFKKQTGMTPGQFRKQN